MEKILEKYKYKNIELKKLLLVFSFLNDKKELNNLINLEKEKKGKINLFFIDTKTKENFFKEIKKLKEFYEKENLKFYIENVIPIISFIEKETENELFIDINIEYDVELCESMRKRKVMNINTNNYIIVKDIHINEFIETLKDISKNIERKIEENNKKIQTLKKILLEEKEEEI